MSTSRGIRPALLITTGALLAGLAAACGTSGQHAATDNSVAPIGATSARSTSSTTSTANSTTTPPTSRSQGTSTIRSTATKTPECRSADLHLSLGAGQGGGAGSSYPAIQFTNSGDHSCVIVGFPGVSYVAGADGHQVGAPASRDGSIGAQTTLAPGQVASAIVRAVNPQNYPTATCKPVSVRGFRVYPPDETASLFLPLHGSAKACSTDIDQLSVQTIKPGTGAE